mgnify:CR=1 FL=1
MSIPEIVLLVVWILVAIFWLFSFINWIIKAIHKDWNESLIWTIMMLASCLVMNLITLIMKLTKAG